MSRNTSKRDLGWSDLGSMLAVILSIAALGVSILEATTVRTAAKAGAWPYIDVLVGYGSDGFSYSLVNKGVGPALVRDAQITHKGQVVNDLDQLIIDVLGPEDAFSYDRYRATDPNRRVMSPEERLNVFSVDWDDATRRLNDNFSENLDVEVCYCSIYDECWRTNLEASEPQSVTRCSVSN